MTTRATSAETLPYSIEQYPSSQADTREQPAEGKEIGNDAVRINQLRFFLVSEQRMLKKRIMIEWRAAGRTPSMAHSTSKKRTWKRTRRQSKRFVAAVGRAVAVQEDYSVALSDEWPAHL